LTISLGVASFPDDGAEPALVLAAADRALFAAKNAGRNRVRVAGS
jgi:diguanylate cyclase (GGDEF)-like protein